MTGAALRFRPLPKRNIPCSDCLVFNFYITNRCTETFLNSYKFTLVNIYLCPAKKYLENCIQYGLLRVGQLVKRGTQRQSILV